ncbi:MAG: ABC transporter permease [Rhodothalassiaceae bacterium]
MSRAHGLKRRLPLPLRIALRELREGLAGFRIFLACLILGVTAIAGIGSLADALIEGMRAQGRSLLAADAELSLFQREIDSEVLDWLSIRAEIGKSLRLRTNIFAPQSGARTLAELRAIDATYPFYGDFRTSVEGDHAALFGVRNGRPGIVLDPLLAGRLSVRIGDEIRLGATGFELRALIGNEPDKANLGFQLGPSAFIGLEAAEATGLLERGSLATHYVKLRLREGLSLDRFVADLDSAFPKRDWRFRTHENSAPGIRAVVRQMGTFLALVGLIALVVGGVGVCNAVRAWLDRKTATIATFKSLGAESRTIFAVYLAQVLLLAGLALLIGLAAGAALPFALTGLLSERLPVPPALGLYAAPLLKAALFGLIVTLAFALMPLARARDIPAARLYRAMFGEVRGLGRPRDIVLLVLIVLGGILAAVLLSSDRMLAAVFILSALAILAMLRGLGWAIARLAARLPRPRITVLRLALANIHRPGAATGPVVLSLGLGLTLFAALALVEGNMNREVGRQIPERAPAFYFVDIGSAQRAEFEALASRYAEPGGLRIEPMIRGAITHLNGIPAEDWPNVGGSGWVLRGDRGLSFAAKLPENNRLVAGEWWDEDYQGPPLVSFSEEEARDLGLKVGDSLTVSVLGRAIEARIASLRALDWGSIDFNFVVLFDPHTLAAAPVSLMATLDVAPGAAEETAYRALTDAFPNATAIRVREVIASFNGILGDVANAVRITAIVAVIAGILVLSGAMAAGHRHRVYDSVILKMLGATRMTVLRAYVLEYLMIGLVTSIVALGLGGIAGWLLVEKALEIPFRPIPLAMLGTVAASLFLTVSFGLIGTWSALGVRPSTVLRQG